MKINNIVNEFAPANNPNGGNYLKALASAWYNGTFNTGDLHKGIKSQEDVERILERGIHCGDGKIRKYSIGYNANFDGVEIQSDDHYEHSDYDDAGRDIDERTGQPWGPYDVVEFGGNELDEDVSEGDVVAFPKKHRGDISDMHDCPKCGGDLQGGKYQGHEVQVCMPCKQVYLPPNSGIDQQGNPIDEMDGDGAGRDGSNRKSHSTYGSRDKHSVSNGPDIHLGPKSMMTSKDVQDRALDTLKKVLSKPENMNVLKRLKTKEGVAEGSDDLVRIEYWQQETMESGRWVKTKPIPRATAEKIVNSFERGEIVDVEQGVAEGLPQTLRKVVPGYAKREIDKKMDAGKFGKTDADKDANFQRYKKIQDKIKEQGVAEGKPKEKEADYGDDYQDMVSRVKKLAGLGPLKTVYDPTKRVYRNVPTAVQPGNKK